MTEFDRLCRTTPARLDVGRSGSRPRTHTLLQFRRDHAAAQDAVWSEWSESFLRHLMDLGLLIVSSAAPDRRTYVLNPPLGRRLAVGEADRIRLANPASASETASQPSGIQLVFSDGLSAIAGERHCDAVVPRLIDMLSRCTQLAVPVAVRNGRVAVADEVAQARRAALVVHLIGERPGLASAESLGCYLTYGASSSTADADRKCISNIHPAGLNPVEAAATIAGVARRILEAQTSGIRLVL